MCYLREPHRSITHSLGSLFLCQITGGDVAVTLKHGNYPNSRHLWMQFPQMSRSKTNFPARPSGGVRSLHPDYPEVRAEEIRRNTSVRR